VTDIDTVYHEKISEHVPHPWFHQLWIAGRSLCVFTAFTVMLFR